MTPTQQICADIAATMDRVRELDIEGHARAAALQCLADARGHLMGYVARTQRPIQTSPFPSVAIGSAGIWPGNLPQDDRDTEPMMCVAPSVPPSCAENARVRNRATESFRKARELLKGIAR